MTRKPKTSSGGANWMDTYGDMVTLLLCFFVLLYSMSSINEDKWKAVVMSFNPNAKETMTENSGNNGPVADPVLDPEGLGSGQIPQESTEETVDEITAEEFDLEQLYQSLLEFSVHEESGESFSVNKGSGRVFLTFNHTMMFNKASPTLRKDIYPVLDEVCGLFDSAKDLIGEVRVVGHTAQGAPDHPNNVAADRRLASDRATNVTIYLQEHSQIEPARLVSEGIGQWRPIASNDTEESRAKNRRVEIIISGRNLETELGGEIEAYDTEPQ